MTERRMTMDDVIELEVLPDGTYGVAGEAYDMNGMGDALDLVASILSELAPGRRAEATAEAIIIAGLATDADGLRNAAANNVPVEQYLQFIDVRALVQMVASNTEQTVRTIRRSGAELGAAYLAGIASTVLFNYITDED